MDIKTTVRSLLLANVFGLVWAISSILVLTSLKYTSPSTAVFVMFVVSTLFMVVLFGKQALEAGRRIFPAGALRLDLRSDTGVMTLAILSLTLVFFLQSIKRYGYAPSGSDSTFLLSSVPVFVVLFSLRFKLEKPALGTAAGAFAALIGAAAIVGNWERPSSFSPFVMFRNEELMLVFSAMSLAVFILAIKELLKKYPPSAIATITLGGSSMLMLMIMLLFDGPRAIFAVSSDGWTVLALSGLIGVTVPVVVMCELTKVTEAGKAAMAVSLLPLFLTAMIAAEKGFGFAIFPTPFQWMPIVIGGLIVVLGVAAAWLEPR